jgi:NDP-sugar pyrophosphorylase family protein
MTAMPSLALLAGGLAKRMRPLTDVRPKAMLEVAGEPFIAHQLRLIRREGIDRVVLCVGYKWEMIRDFVGNGERFGVEVIFRVDGPTLLGTGGALRKALPDLGQEFIVMYGDSWLDTAYAPIVDAFRASGKSALMTVFRNEGQWDHSNVWFENGQIRSYDKKNIVPRMHHIDWGLGVLKSQVLADRPADSPFDLADVYSELVRKGELAGFEVNERFYEIGSPEGLQETDALLRSPPRP